MDWKTHRMFGYMIADHFDMPVYDFIEYTILPDLRFYQDYFLKHVLFHRWTLHGPENIDAVIEKGKKSKYVKYNPEHDKYIRCLIMSHSYLDLFNFVLHPSYPGNYSFTYIRSQLAKIITFRTVRTPKGLDIVLNKMIRLHKDPYDLFHTMLIEYRSLPDKLYWIRQISKLY